jgi:RimJ/RimL family protein N-acetyltransferase
MDHDVYLAGYNFALRPIRLDDVPLIIELRSNRDRARFLNPISSDADAQASYLNDYFSRPGDYYFVVERLRTTNAEGLIALYDVDAVLRRAEAGRWIVRQHSSAAVESIWLAYRIAFDLLGLEEVFCRTIAQNSPAASFHDSCGLERVAVRRNDILLEDRWFDRIEHRLHLDRWPLINEKLSRLARCQADLSDSCRAA